ncbi:MAG: hypothetical protein E7K64_02670, partial [Clostridia bacterium]|nr:hypothetical protein [Clostridia bacterium]
AKDRVNGSCLTRLSETMKKLPFLGVQERGGSSAAEATRREKPVAPTIDDHDNDVTRINLSVNERAHGRRSDNPVEPMDPKNPLSGDHDA